MNWSALIAELIALDMTQDQIASEVGASQPSISALATGKTGKPNFELGDKLRRLHARKTRARAKQTA